MRDEWLRARGARAGQRRDASARRDRRTGTRRRSKLFDANGHRRDVVEFHPAYHELMSYLQRHGAAAGPWAAPGPGAHVARAAFYYMYAQIEDGTLCPTTMTYASVPALRATLRWPRSGCRASTRCEYDPRFVPAAAKARRDASAWA